MKLGVIGSGMIVPEFLSVCKNFDEIELKAICGTQRSAEKTESIKNEFNICNAYSDIEQFLQEDLDVVYIGVPNNLHYEIAKQVLESNKNVIVEKPFTSNLEEAEKLVVLASERKLYIFEAISNQYLPNFNKTKELLKDLGDIKLVNMNFSQYSSRYDAFKQGIVAPVFDKEKGGGALVDLGVYNIHFIVGLFGAPLSATYFPNIERGVDTSGVLFLDYPSFKCVSICAKDSKAPLGINIQGDKGCIHSKSSANMYDEFLLIENSGVEHEYRLNKDKHRLYYEIEQFVEHFNKNDENWFKIQNEQTLIVMKILDLARENI